MHDLSKEEFYRAIDDLRQRINGINERLDLLNGRTRKTEVKVAVQWMLWVIAGAFALWILNAAQLVR